MWCKSILAVLLLVTVAPSLFAQETTVRIGVLSHRGYEATLEAWSPTAEYLSRAISGHEFVVVPLDFDEVEPAVQFGQVDFLLVNSGIYVTMEVRYRVSRIATMNNLVQGVSLNAFGGVIFTRSDRNDINRLEDLSGKRFMAVDSTSLGGYQMAWREMLGVGLEPQKHFSELSFGGIHDNVVMAVLRGGTDVGTVRTGILERMATDGVINITDFKIINPQMDPEFLLVRSTALYPEWPFSKLQHTPNKLAQQVAVALLNMSDHHSAAIAGQYAGWTVPLDYQGVHQIFRELKLPPYALVSPFTWIDAVRKYWLWLVAGVGVLLVLLVLTLWVIRLNRALNRSQRLLMHRHDLILNSVVEGIFGVDLEGKATFINQAMENITGWKASDILGRSQHDILHHTKADGTPYQRESCPAYATNQDSVPRYVDDDIFWKKDGTSIPVEYTSTPMRNEQGKVTGSVVVFRDISERKQAEDAARQHQSDLAHVARLSTMGEMASGMAHEINQPLTAIATNAHACIRLLEGSKVPSDRVADVVERIASQAERAGEIIRQLRQFVRKEQQQRSRVNLNELIDEVVVLIKPEARKERVKIELDLDEGIGKVLVQRIQIEQVIFNLAHNSIEAMQGQDSERRLVIQTGTGGQHAVIVTVKDSGPGLDRTLGDQVFNPFVTTKSEGMGLGLSISQGIIEAHEGILYCDTEEGYGAVFRFMLPVSPAASERRTDR